MVPGNYNLVRRGGHLVPPLLYQGGPGAAGNNEKLWERPPVFGYDLIVTTIAEEWQGGTIATSFPNAKRLIQSPAFDVDIGLVGMVLVTSLVNDQADTRFGVWAAIDIGPDLDLQLANRCFIGAMTQQNSSAGGVPNPSSKSTSLSFGENAAIRTNSGQRIALYVTGTNSGQIGAATLTIYTIQLYRGKGG